MGTTSLNDTDRGLTEAIGHYLSAIELDPSSLAIRAELAGVHRRRAAGRRLRDDLEGALADLLRARELTPQDEAIQSELAEACGAHARARSPLRHADSPMSLSPRGASPVRVYPELGPIAQGQFLRLERVLRHNRVQSHYSSAGPVAVSHDGSLIAVACGTSVEVWDAFAGKRLADLPVVELRSVAIGGATLAVTTFDAEEGKARLLLWDVHVDRAPEARLPLELEGSYEDLQLTMTLSPGGNRLATRGNDSATLWDLQKGEVLCRIEQASLRTIAFSSDARQLMLASESQVDVIDVASGNVVSSVRLPWRCERACLLGGNRALLVEREEHHHRGLVTVSSVLHIVDLGTGNEVRRISMGTIAVEGPLVLGSKCFLTEEIRDQQYDLKKRRLTGSGDVLGCRILGFDLDTGDACETLDLGAGDVEIGSVGINLAGPVLVVAGPGSLLVYRVDAD